jgi:hypothetical protein
MTPVVSLQVAFHAKLIKLEELSIIEDTKAVESFAKRSSWRSTTG